MQVYTHAHFTPKQDDVNISLKKSRNSWALFEHLLYSLHELKKRQ